MECYCYLRNIQDRLSDGKTPYERRFGMPFNGPVTPFGAMVEYHPISAKDQSWLHQFCPKVSPGIFFGYAWYAGGIWKGDIMIAEIWRIGGDGRIRHPRQKAQCKGSVNANEMWQFYISSRRWNSQNTLRRSTSETIHLNQGSSWTRRRTRSFSRRIRRTLISKPSSRRLNTGRCGRQKWFLVYSRRFHLPSRGTQSQNCTCRKKNHFPFRWRRSTLPEQHTRDLMNCVKNRLMIAGMWMEKENYLMHGQVSQDSFYWTKGHLKDMHGPRGDWRGNKQLQDPTVYGQRCGSIGLMQRKAKQNKNGLSRNQSSIMPDSCVVSSSLNLRMKNSDTS